MQPGTYSSTAAATACDDCWLGSYSTGMGSSSCTTCALAGVEPSAQVLLALAYTARDLGLAGAPVDAKPIARQRDARPPSSPLGRSHLTHRLAIELP